MFSISAFSVTTDENKTISRLKGEATDKGYIKVSEGFSASCLYGVVYFDISSSSGKGYLSVLLAAKMASKPIAIDYDKAANDICTLSAVAID
jgi:hypothetical protein